MTPNEYRVAVIGAGKMGLPIAAHMARRGVRVTACDVNAELVATINAGKSPFDEPGLDEAIAGSVEARTLSATTDSPAAIAESNVVIVLVPVLLTPERDADLRIIREVAATIGRSMQAGTLVIFETTLPVGTTRGLVPLLEDGGLAAGTDFHLVFSPERVKSRLVLERLGQTPKVVGGLTPECAHAGEVFYARALGAPLIDAGSLEAAEMAKLADMIYRDVNIALANELARYAAECGVDFEPVRQAANTSGEAAILLPGIGVGGHCTPIYPHFALRDAERRGLDLSLTHDGRSINDGQAAWVLDRLEKLWRPLAGRRVLLLGLGFRPEVKEHTCSPAFRVRDALIARDAEVRLADPLYSPAEIGAHGFEPHDRPDEPWAEVLVGVTMHRAFERLDWTRLANQGLQAVVDGRNGWVRADIEAAGLVYVGIGR